MPPYLCLITLIACLQVTPALAEEQTLTKAIDAISLTDERALEFIPIAVEGVVTAAQSNWGGRFFVQDATGGIFVENVDETQPSPGDVVRVIGVSHPGGFAPIIAGPQWEKIGTSALPPARPVSTERLMMGVEDSQRVEIGGIVRTARIEPNEVAFQIRSGGFRFQAMVPSDAVENPEALIGARVRMRGTAAATFNPQLRQAISMNLFVPVKEDFIVEQTEARDPFEGEVISIGSLGQYRREQAVGGRVRVQGMVSYHRPGEELFLIGDEGGLRVRSDEKEIIEPGTVVEVVGFPDYENYLPVLQDATVRKKDGVAGALESKRIGNDQLPAEFHNLHHGDLISLEGELMDRTVISRGSTEEGALPERVLLSIKSPGLVFTAEGPAIESNAELVGIPLGSKLRLSGVCVLQIDDEGNRESLRLLLPSVAGVDVLEEPGWLTPRRLLLCFALLSVLSVLAFGWVVTVSRKNVAQRHLIREKEKAQDELQQAHDTLDQRVQERTAQLKIEANERKEAEVRFKATLAERTRLAQELHDTTEQSLTGIGLQLDTAAKLFESGVKGSDRPLSVARDLIGRSHEELRQSIWNLRSRELEEFDLANALRMSAEELLEGSGVAFSFETIGRPYPLSEVVEENLLRIGREGVSNVIKHAGAGSLKLSLGYGDGEVALSVRDDGCGFSPESAPGAEEGHFGLLGMSERAKRLDGRFSVTSKTDQGTALEVRIPVEVPRESETATANRG